MNNFPQEKLDALKKQIDRALENENTPRIAAFDADGTLWNTDMGESLFNYQVQNELVSELPSDPWAHYHQLKEEVSHQAAYLWLAQINKGVPEEQLLQWAQETVENQNPFPIFRAQQELIQHLKENGVQIYIVTASIKWAVQPAAPLVGVPMSQVIGIETTVKDGLISEEPSGPITWREGKVHGLLEKTGGKSPFFCAGNTLGDLPLLESATHLRLVMAASPEGNRNFESERELLQVAEERSWFFHSYW